MRVKFTVPLDSRLVVMSTVKELRRMPVLSRLENNSFK